MKVPLNKYGYDYLVRKIKEVKDHLSDLFDEKIELKRQGDIRENSGLDIVVVSINAVNKKLQRLTSFKNNILLLNEEPIAKVGSKIVLENGTNIILTLFKTIISKDLKEIYISSELKMAQDIFYKKEGDEHSYTLNNITIKTKIKSIIDLGDIFENIER